MWSRAVVAALLLAACGGEKKQGVLGADCYPNGTCNVTLTCMGGLCVASSTDAATGSDAATDAPIDAARRDAPIDAPTDTHVDGRPDAPPDAYCDAVVATPPDGHHNAGETCLTAGCHLIGNTGAGAPEFSYAGTLYRDAAGTTAFPGATIAITVGSQLHKVVVGTNGNFFLSKALANPPTAAMPATALASACPDTVMMAGQLVDNGGNCNNCHRQGGTTSPLHLP